MEVDFKLFRVSRQTPTVPPVKPGLSCELLPTTKRNGFGKEPKVEKRDVYIGCDANAVPTPTPFKGDT